MQNQSFEQKLRRRLEDVARKDPKLNEELKEARERRAGVKPGDLIEESSASDDQKRRPPIVAETIVLRVGRPVLAVSNDRATLTFADAESEVWRERLERARDGLHHAIKAAGRIEVERHPHFSWIGTGWLVADDVVVTNRHVAREFALHRNGSFTFKQGAGGPMTAAIDFLEEVDRADSLAFSIASVMYIAPEDGPDVAFLRVQPRGDVRLAQPIPLSERDGAEGEMVAVIGYPARDSRIPEPDLMAQIFGDVYDKKRLAPGQLLAPLPDLLLHDCSTLGGNSGSVVLSLESGKAAALHFAGRFLQANYAVPASTIADLLHRARRGGAEAVTTSAMGSGQIDITIPLHLRIALGDPQCGRPSPIAVAGASLPSAPKPAAPPAPFLSEDFFAPEGRPEDYANREGYQAAFLGDDARVPLPRVTGNPADVLRIGGDNGGDELKYEHFSVKMSRARRMCIFSAVNIDGGLSRKVKRSGWRTDPRIPAAAQIRDECYGNPPRFSRGHMTRREDPVWGTAAQARRGQDDSMHVTNAVPQMQAFNAPIWLGLEDYALDHAREDDMKISVFTGPIFAKNDPMRYGVKIPVRFWKVIAFIHDETGALSATGYIMSQRSYLQEEEFVFGQHETSQEPISKIEALTGLSFGPLAEADPLAGGEESVGVLVLTDPSQIRFR